MSVCRNSLGSLFTPTLAPAAWSTCCLCRTAGTASPDFRRLLVVLAVVVRHSRELDLVPRHGASRWEPSGSPPRHPSRDGPDWPQRFLPNGH
jgi:hypothetical protein